MGAKLLRSAVPAAVRVATAGALDLDALSEKTISDWTGKVAEEQIAAYESARRSIRSFRESIAEIAKTVSSAASPIEARPLVIVIDELDRCRPTYAVRVLECIKHFFAVPGVMFVFAVDSTQLSHAVRSQYGQSMDAVGYLRRFFDLELSLPEPTESQFSLAQFERFGLEKVFAERRAHSSVGDEKGNVLETFDGLFRVFRCSLRDRERCFTLLAFALRTTPKSHYLHPVPLAALIVLKVRASILYSSFSEGSATPEDVIEAIAKGPAGGAFLESWLGEWLLCCLYAVSAPRGEIGQTLARLDERLNASDDEATKTRLKSLMEALSRREIRGMIGSLAYIVGKIDLVSAK